MAWQMSSDRPIYTQLYDKILIRIVCGIYKAGNRLPSVRELAAEANRVRTQWTDCDTA